jgi:dTDP-glucose pyrophosphorylase
MLNILIPMAGAGSRFTTAGFLDPKPLIKVFNQTMIELVIKNLTPKIAHRFLFVAQEEHFKKYQISKAISSITTNCEFILINELTEGAACTVLKAEEYIDSNEPLMIANADQFIDYSIDKYLEKEQIEDDGIIMTMFADDPKWSFIKVDPSGLVTEIAEKRIISNLATVGVYNFKKGKDFVSGAKKMISLNDRVNSEFYVAPVYNHLIKNNFKLRNITIGNLGSAMYGLGTPNDLEFFIQNFKGIEL